MENVHFFCQSSFLAARKLSLIARDYHLTIGNDYVPKNTNILICGNNKVKLKEIENINTLIVPYSQPDKELHEIITLLKVNSYSLKFTSRYVAEMAIALWLSISKNIVINDTKFRNGEWSKIDSLSILNSKVLVLGYGKIGKQVATLCSALGAVVSVIRESIKEPEVENCICIYPKEYLINRIEETDAIICCLPLKESTYGLINSTILNKIQKHCVLINVGRAEVINEKALFHSLKKGIIYGAALDVWPNESLVSSNYPSAVMNFPFQTLENVILSPHCGWRIKDVENERAYLLNSGIKALINGVEMPSNYIKL